MNGRCHLEEDGKWSFTRGLLVASGFEVQTWESFLAGRMMLVE